MYVHPRWHEAARVCRYVCVCVVCDEVTGFSCTTTDIYYGLTCQGCAGGIIRACRTMLHLSAGFGVCVCVLVIYATSKSQCDHQLRTNSLLGFYCCCFLVFFFKLLFGIDCVGSSDVLSASEIHDTSSVAGFPCFHVGTPLAVGDTVAREASM